MYMVNHWIHTNGLIIVLYLLIYNIHLFTLLFAVSALIVVSIVVGNVEIVQGKIGSRKGRSTRGGTALIWLNSSSPPRVGSLQDTHHTRRYETQDTSR